MSHTPVLLHEVIEYLNPQPGKFIIDGTIGGGGHAVGIFKEILPNGRVLGVDLDISSLERAREKISTEIKNPSFVPLSGTSAGRQKSNIKNNLILVSGNYADIPKILKTKQLPKADGLLLDLGFSSDQLRGSGRGFSFDPAAENEPLIMTYGDDREPVRNLLRKTKEYELEGILKKFGDERFAKRIARAIVSRERKKPIETAGELAAIVEAAVPGIYERGRIHPATRTFQALRIYANDELGNLERVLNELSEILDSQGRVAVISFHSLEDRIVKHTFRDLERQHILKIMTKKPVTASPEEMRENPRNRSAKLRAAEIM